MGSHDKLLCIFVVLELTFPAAVVLSLGLESFGVKVAALGFFSLLKRLPMLSL